MKTYCRKPRTAYSTPLCWPVEIKPEGILCESSDDDGKNESYDSWNNYDNEGWH